MDKYTLGDVFDGECTREEYAAQYKTATLEVGGIYVQFPGTWQETQYKIIFIEEKTALGVEVKGLSMGTKPRQLFYSSGCFQGWKHNDTARPGYRLQNIKPEPTK